MFRHDLDLLAGRDLLQFDKVGQQPPDRHRLAGRQLGAAAFGDLQPDLIGGKESEAAGDGIHQRRIVARHHAEVIADPIVDVRQAVAPRYGGSIFRKRWAPALFCNSLLTSTFIGETSPSATIALTAEAC